MQTIQKSLRPRIRPVVPKPRSTRSSVDMKTQGENTSPRSSSFNHISTVPANDTQQPEVHAEQEISQSKQLSGEVLMDLSHSLHQPHLWPTPSDQRLGTTRSASLTSVKAQGLRTDKRNVKSEAAIDDSTKQKNGNRKAWKPLDITGSSDDAGSLEDRSSGTPLDAHASVFQPFATPHLITASTYPNNHEVDTEDPSRDGAIFYGGYAKATATGLNAYQVKEDDRVHSVLAAFDEAEINGVFGELPSPSYYANHSGTKNGSVQFCLHPNGDISARQWDSRVCEWTNIGHYSNVRKKTEGGLQNQSLRGETAEQSLKRNTMRYFYAIAKQKEADTVGYHFSQREIRACFGHRSLEMGPTDVVHPIIANHGHPSTDDFQSSSITETPSSTDSRANGYGYMLFGDQSSPTPMPYSNRFEYDHRADGAERVKQVVSTSSGPASHDLCRYYRPHLNERPNVSQSQASLGAAQPFEDQRRHPLLFAGQNHYPPYERPLLSLGDTSRGAISYKDQRAVDAHLERMYGHASDFPDPIVGDNAMQHSYRQRSDYKDMLQKVGSAATARGGTVIPKPVGRTVLHDPYRESGMPPKPQRPETYAGNVENIGQSRAREGYNTVTHRALPHDLLKTLLEPEHDVKQDSGRLADLNRDSIIEPDQTRHYRAVADYTRIARLPISHEPMVPQNFNGPFFTKTRPSSPEKPGTAAHEVARRTRVREWYFSNSRIQRDDEHFAAIKAMSALDPTSAVKKTAASGVSKDPGIIGRPSANKTGKAQDQSQPKDMSAEKAAQEQQDDMLRLLVPFVDNLQFYTQTPAEKRYHPFLCPYVAPPEWAIDHSEEGNNSCWDENWGNPPRRIGRDERYRPLRS